MSKRSEFHKKGETQVVYWKNTFDNEYAVFKRLPNGDIYTKHENLGEYKSNDSKMAFDSMFYDLQELTEEEYNNFPRNISKLF